MIELIANGQLLDVSEDVVFPLNFSQADAKEPSKRKRNSSKTITLPGTQVNNNFFSSAYDLNLTDVLGDLVGFDFDPTIRYPCRVNRFGSNVFIGGMHLTKVTTKSDVTNGRINEFSIVLYSEIPDLFQSLGDMLIGELGWSNYNHLLSIPNIANSWSAVVGTGYWYPYADYGYSAIPRLVKTNQLLPHVYITECIRKCLEVAGLNMSSQFLTSALIRRVAIGHGGGELIGIGEVEAANRRVKYRCDADTNYSLAPTAVLDSFFGKTSGFNNTKFIPISDNDVVSAVVNNDTLLQFDEIGGNLVVANSGDYNINVTAPIRVDYSMYPGALVSSSYQIAVELRVFRNGAVLAGQIVNLIDDGPGSQIANFAIEQALALNSGDIVKFDVRIVVDGTLGVDIYSQVLDIRLNFNNAYFFDLTAVDKVIIDGDLVEVARFLPKIKAADFLNDMITMFNLYISDPYEDGTVVVEPMPTYFLDSDDTDNFTDKLDRSQDIEIEPAQNIQGKRYRFRFAEDRDYYKNKYHQLLGHDYGDFDYDVPSTFKKGDVEFKLKTIAQTCPVQIEGFNIIIPTIVSVDESTLVTSPYKGKARIYINNGLKASDRWYIKNSLTGVDTEFMSYPQAHHLDSLTTPTFDLNFGKPKMVFYHATAYTDSNLYDRYYDAFIREVTGRDSKIINAWFRLTEIDFYTNFMRKLVNIDGVVYRKNLVKDWIVNSNNLVKVELIRLVSARSKKNYQSTIPEVTLPDMGGTGGGNMVTGTTVATSSQQLYIVDVSMGNVSITLDSTKIRNGWEGTFKLVAPSQNSLKLVAAGVQGTTIDGAPSRQYGGQYRVVKVAFNGSQFYITN